VSEGEFKKQIDKFPSIPSMIPVNLSLLQERVNEQNKWIWNSNQILDEAKKEIPTENHTIVTGSKTAKQSKQLETIYRYINELEAFLIKWFGEPEK